MIIRTRVFEMCDGKYRNLTALAQAMGLSVSQVYRVREGKRSINQKFIIGAKKAFPEHQLDELFYLDSEHEEEILGSFVTKRYQHILEQYHSLGVLDR